MNLTIHHARGVVSARSLGLAAVFTFVVGHPVGAEPAATLFVGGGGIAQIDANGTVVVEGPALVQDKHLRTMLDATIHATMTSSDGTLPAIGDCEPASAAVIVDGERDSDMTLASEGTVCHVRHPAFPAYVTVEFRGLHHVTQAKRPQLRGVTGSLSITMSPGGFTSLHADSFVPNP